ncbi:MAG: ABC transporter ATP-binding protein [Spirochaetota bacterium]
MTKAGGPEAAVSVERVGKTYVLGQRRVIALDDVSLTVDGGTFCAITGPSGSGKSTLLNIIGLLDTPETGYLRVCGVSSTTLSRRRAARFRRSNVGLVFQDFNLVPVLTVFENVQLPALAGGRPYVDRERDTWVMHLLDACGLKSAADQLPTQLSGGQQQRVAIARALVNRPKLVLADEPTANLDSRTGAQIIALMRTFNENLDTTFVFATHDAAIRDVADRSIALRDGSLVAT